MNHEPEEKRIKELFLELKREEALQAPAFETVWVAASAAGAGSRWRRHFLRVTAAAAAFVALGVALSLVLNRQPAAPPPPNLAGNVPGSSNLPWRSVVLASQWHSPTDFLLESPVERVLPNGHLNQFPGDTTRKN